jgi:hypothetical protein
MQVLCGSDGVNVVPALSELVFVFYLNNVQQDAYYKKLHVFHCYRELSQYIKRWEINFTCIFQYIVDLLSAEYYLDFHAWHINSDIIVIAFSLDSCSFDTLQVFCKWNINVMRT